MRRSLIAVTLTAALFGGSLVDEAGARRKPSSLSARIKGRKFKAASIAAVGAYAFGPTLGILSVGGATKPHLRIGSLIRATAAACITPDLATAAFPLMLSSCSGNYYEYKLGHPEATKVWQTSTGMQMTITAFDGTRVQGTMSGTLDTPPTGEAAVAVESGKFSIRLSVGGG